MGMDLMDLALEEYNLNLSWTFVPTRGRIP